MDLLINKKRKNSKLGGTVEVSGAKNSAVCLIPAALLSSETVIINNVPDISDCHNLVSIIKDLGHFIEFNDNCIKIKRAKKCKWHLNDAAGKLRGSYYFIGAYLGFYGKIAMKSIGGCDLGERPTNFHHDAFIKLGAKYERENEFDIYKVRKIKASFITLPFPSVGATMNILLASVLGKGITTISNYAKEIEVLDVINFLNSMGADITGYDSEKLVIKGVKKLFKTTYTIVPDRIEAGTYLAFGCLKDNNPVTVTGINPKYLESFLKVLKDIGHNIKVTNNSITASKGSELKPVDITTSPYPGFPTDLGPIIVPLLSQIEGVSTLKETIFKDRFSYLNELNSLGANITRNNDTLHIKGVTTFNGGVVRAYDLRCAACLVIASCISLGDVTIKNIEYLKRGYQKCYQKLESLKIKCQEIN